MDKTKRNILLLEKIAKHCEEIAETHAEFGDSYELFRLNKPYFKAMAMDLLQIGELANHLSKDFIKKYSDIPFPAIIALRNIVVHGYGLLDKESMWNTSHHKTPALHTRCLEILAEIEPKTNNNEKNSTNFPTT